MKPVRLRPGIGVVTTVLVSDGTSLVVLGLTARQFRTFVRKRGIPDKKVGRRTVARLDHVLEATGLSGVDSCRPDTAWSEDAVVAMASRPRARGGAR